VEPSRPLGTKRFRSIAGALVLALAVSIGAMATTGTAAAECGWQQRSKRVVKKVIRHGKPRRVVKVKRWRVCVPRPSAPTGIATPDPAPTSAPSPSPPDAGPAPPPTPQLERLGVWARDVKGEEAWTFTLSRPDIPTGEAIVELNNESGDPHNLNLQRQGGGEEPVLAVSEAGPEERRSARFALPAGTYRLWCSLPTHEEKGMVATLVVDGD